MAVRRDAALADSGDGGDISCQPGTPQESEKLTDTCDQGSGSTVRDAAQNATAEQVEGMKPNLVAVLGDELIWAGPSESRRRVRRHPLAVARTAKVLPDPHPGPLAAAMAPGDHGCASRRHAETRRQPQATARSPA
ncbi:MAG: hypothetical protein ACXVRP_08875 [Solirubrobacteraceae bacterium]